MEELAGQVGVIINGVGIVLIVLMVVVAFRSRLNRPKAKRRAGRDGMDETWLASSDSRGDSSHRDANAGHHHDSGGGFDSTDGSDGGGGH